MHQRLEHISDYGPPNQRKRKHVVNEKFFDSLNEVSAYWLGFLIADGCVHVRVRHSCFQFVVSASSKDEEHLLKLRADMGCSYPLSQGTGVKQLNILSYDLCVALERLGLTQRKSKTVEPPNLTEDLEVHMLRGIVDGDGCFNVYKRPNGQTVPTLCVVGSEGTCKVFKRFFQRGCIARKAGVYQFSITGKKAIEGIKLLYAGKPALERKFKLAIDLGIVNA